MTKREFVQFLWEHAMDYDGSYMSLETARADLENFRAEDGWDVPEDLTAEEYAEIWNGLVDAQRAWEEE